MKDLQFILKKNHEYWDLYNDYILYLKNTIIRFEHKHKNLFMNIISSFEKAPESKTRSRRLMIFHYYLYKKAGIKIMDYSNFKRFNDINYLPFLI